MRGGGALLRPHLVGRLLGNTLGHPGNTSYGTTHGSNRPGTEQLKKASPYADTCIADFLFGPLSLPADVPMKPKHPPCRRSRALQNTISLRE